MPTFSVQCLLMWLQHMSPGRHLLWECPRDKVKVNSGSWLFLKRPGLEASVHATRNTHHRAPHHLTFKWPHLPTLQDLAQVSSPSPMPLLQGPQTPQCFPPSPHMLSPSISLHTPTPTLDSSSLNAEMIYIHIYAVSGVPGNHSDQNCCLDIVILIRGTQSQSCKPPCDSG